jgi:hypothetical protein
MNPMQSASHRGIVSRRATKPPSEDAASSRGTFDRSREAADRTTTTKDEVVEVLLSTTAAAGKRGDAVSDPVTERKRQLVISVMQRIESRLPGRVRNLSVRIASNTVVLEGQCATYYTKQLAQHAALGVLEDEQLENAIMVTIGQ